jgi:hypothetical protein
MRMTKLNTLTKVNDSITLYRYDNGWMVEVGGRDKDNDWKNTKTVCNSETELIAIIKEWNEIEKDS